MGPETKEEGLAGKIENELKAHETILQSYLDKANAFYQKSTKGALKKGGTPNYWERLADQTMDDMTELRRLKTVANLLGEEQAKGLLKGMADRRFGYVGKA